MTRVHARLVKDTLEAAKSRQRPWSAAILRRFAVLAVTLPLSLLFNILSPFVAVSARFRVHPRPIILLFLATAPALSLAEPAPVPYAEPDAPGMMQSIALSGNLLANGSFEQGKYWPVHWEPADKLGVIWAKGGSDGARCLRMDTNLQDTQWAEWNAKILKIGEELAARGDPQALSVDPIPAPPAREPTKPPYYDTVASIHGIHYRSEFIKLEPGAIYRFTVDGRTTAKGDPKVFIKGFVDLPRKTEKGEVMLRRDAGNAMLTLVHCGPDWQRWVCVFHPARWRSTLNDKPIQAQWLRVDLYAYWPVGVYEFDNARLEIIGHEEIEQKEAPTAAPAAEPAKSGAIADDGEEFTVIK